MRSEDLGHGTDTWIATPKGSWLWIYLGGEWILHKSNNHILVPMYQSFKIMCRHDLATVFKEGGPAIVIEDYLITPATWESLFGT